MIHVRPIEPFDPARLARGLAALGVRDTVLLESSLPGGARGRWTIAAWEPERRHRFDEATGWAITGAPATPALAAFEQALLAHPARPWEGLRAAERAIAPPADAPASPDAPLPPFRGGFAVALSYDAARCLDGFGPWPSPRPADAAWPWFDLRLHGALLALDHATGRAFAIAREHPLFARPADERLEQAIAGAARALAAAPGADAAPGAPGALATAPAALRSNLTDAAYAAAFDRLQEYLRAGDLYQANLTRRFATACAADAPALYARLRATAPAPYAALFDDPDRALVSASPELFLARAGDRLVTRPIKGTRPRDPDPARDTALAAELAASAKDRAEHVMIVDVHRNDLGRVCRFGSVRVPALAAHEAFPTVHHLTSTIEGTLRPDAGAWDAIAAAFPAGSITGAPKRRACEVIEELEPTRRALYCGALGAWDLGGDFALNVAIRTILLAGGEATFQAGGGIVVDSRVELEAAETWSKARALHAAVTTAEAAAETAR